MEGPTALAEGSTPPGKRLRNAIHIFSNDLRPISQGFIVSLGVLIGNRTITVLYFGLDVICISFWNSIASHAYDDLVIYSPAHDFLACVFIICL
jgi:hypothetical protein